MERKEEKQRLTVKVMEDEDFVDYLLKQGEDEKEVRKVWHRLQKIKNET